MVMRSNNSVVLLLMANKYLINIDRLSAAVKLGNRAAVNNLLLLPNLDVEQPDCHSCAIIPNQMDY